MGDAVPYPVYKDEHHFALLLYKIRVHFLSDQFCCGSEYEIQALQEPSKVSWDWYMYTTHFSACQERERTCVSSSESFNLMFI